MSIGVYIHLFIGIYLSIQGVCVRAYVRACLCVYVSVGVRDSMPSQNCISNMMLLDICFRGELKTCSLCNR